MLRGELVAILDLAAGRRRSPKPEVITNALAGPGFEPRGALLIALPGWARPTLGVAQTVGFGLGRSKMLYLSMGID